MAISIPFAVDTGIQGLPDTERRVLLELILHGGQSRVRIAERLGLSRTSLTRVTRQLLDAGFVIEGEMQLSGTRGRPAEALYLRQDAARFAGVKLTADQLYLVVTDLSATIVAETAVALPSRKVEDVVALIAHEIARLEDQLGALTGVGIAAAGDVRSADRGPILQHSNFLGWDEVPLARLVADASGIPATLVNDVHALTGAQHWFGGEERHRSLVVYGVGAGIGCGVVIAEELHLGAHGRAGRIGHSRIGGRGRRCENGHRDCIHSFVTMPAIEQGAGVEAGEYALALDRARGGEAVALGAFESAARALGAAVADAVNAYDPDMVAIMGEGVDMLDLAPEQFRTGLAEFLEQGDAGSILIDRPPFHFDLYARGAAVAVMRELLA
ncbi:ROK family transcriptional regulator [Microbacterium pumilum]|uniref:ROK family transcriptional regulator n=1 Tax=Microbacterium pumilum TaxID=344165 RepID=A0ABN2T492_9MICO